jgi:dihydropteroate synthase
MRITPIEVKNEKQAKKLMASLGVSKEGLKILCPKSLHSAFKIEGIRSWEANIIKQHLLSLGTDAAIQREALVKDIKTAVFIFGNLSQLRKLCFKLKNQPFNLEEISESISSYLDTCSKKEFIFRARDKILKINKPVVCGIINLTDDSFSGDGLLGCSQAVVLKKVEEMVKAGAKMIDVGAESSRPFSKPIRKEAEIKRLVPIIRTIRKKFKKILISTDTYKYSVAKAAFLAGADIINDITALRGDLRMASLVKKHKLGCILMHMKGKPQNMQINPKYKDVVAEEIDFFKQRLEFIKEKGIKQDQVLIDPGIGFGKRLQDNVKIIDGLYKFKILGRPIFLGLSRKSFVGDILKAKVQDRLVGTISASVVSLAKGVNILRVHDVKETVQAIKVASKILEN